MHCKNYKIKLYSARTEVALFPVRSCLDFSSMELKREQYGNIGDWFEFLLHQNNSINQNFMRSNYVLSKLRNYLATENTVITW